MSEDKLQDEVETFGEMSAEAKAAFARWKDHPETADERRMARKMQSGGDAILHRECIDRQNAEHRRRVRGR